MTAKYLDTTSGEYLTIDLVGREIVLQITSATTGTYRRVYLSEENAEDIVHKLIRLTT